LLYFVGQLPRGLFCDGAAFSCSQRGFRLVNGRENFRPRLFSETDFTEDLKKFDVPTLMLHGDDDQIVPIAAAAPLSAKLVKNAKLKIYPGYPHGMPATNADRINADVLAFIKGETISTAA